MSFGMIKINQSISTMKDNATWIQIALLFMFMKTLQMMLKKGLIYQIMKLIDHCLREKIKKSIGLMKYELGGNLLHLDRKYILT